MGSETCPKCGQPYRHTSNCGYIVFACGTMVYEKSGGVSHGVDCLETQLAAAAKRSATIEAKLRKIMGHADSYAITSLSDSAVAYRWCFDELNDLLESEAKQ